MEVWVSPTQNGPSMKARWVMHRLLRLILPASDADPPARLVDSVAAAHPALVPPSAAEPAAVPGRDTVRTLSKAYLHGTIPAAAAAAAMMQRQRTHGSIQTARSHVGILANEKLGCWTRVESPPSGILTASGGSSSNSRRHSPISGNPGMPLNSGSPRSRSHRRSSSPAHLVWSACASVAALAAAAACAVRMFAPCGRGGADAST